MRRLRDFQVVSLSAGKAPMSCRVIAVGGEEAILEPEETRRFGDLSLPARATLGFEFGGHPVMLSGRAVAGPIDDTLRFVVTDHVTINELRLQPRLTATFDIEIGEARDGLSSAVPVQRMEAADISPGGTFIKGLHVPADTRMSLTVHVPGLPQPINCNGRIVRSTAAGAATAFEDIEPEDAAILEELIYSVRKAICRQATENAARRARMGRVLPPRRNAG